MRKKLVCLVLSAAMIMSSAMAVHADLEQDLQEDAAWMESQLSATYAAIDQLYYQRQALAEQEAVLNDNLFTVMVDIQVLESDITAKAGEIEKTEGDLNKANNARDKQFESMKQRIQYLYEKGGDDAWFAMLLAAEDVSDLLTRAEYTQKMYEEDRKSLQKYANTISEIQDLENRYIQEKADLEGMKQESEDLYNELDYQLAVTQANSADCENEIAYAEYMATEYANQLVATYAELDRLEQERLAAEAAAAEAAAAEAAAAEEEDYTVYDLAEEAGVDADEAEETAKALTVYDEEGNAISAKDAADSGAKVYDSDGEEVDASEVVEKVTSSKGQDVVDFALQFVGNPYVWGGESLTDGADCSGFAQSVFANFGVSLPRTSYEQQNAGYEVSYADAQPGDLICYGGHVAIYMGDGKIVHASNETEGIKISDNAAYRTITSVRRLV